MVLFIFLFVLSRDRVAALIYHVLDGQDRVPVVQIDERGLLNSGSLIGLSTVQVISQEPFGINQTLTITIKVVFLCSFSPVLFKEIRMATAICL